MPIYEYRCQSCGEVQEIMQKVNEPAPEACPKCGATQPLERLVSRSSFHLKGSGWYSDLYGSKKKESTSSTDVPASSTTSSTAPAKPAGETSGSSSGTPSPSGSAGSSSSSGSTK